VTRPSCSHSAACSADLNAVLDVGGARFALEAVGKAFARQALRFNLFNALDSLRSQNLGD
jgi:hypothetical protein